MAKRKKPGAPDGDGAAPAVFRARREAATDNNIRNWRLFRGLARQEDLAALTLKHDPQGRGIQRPTLIRLETGELQYNAGHLRLISLALGVAPRDLIGTNPNDAGDIFAVYSGLPEADKPRATIVVTGPLITRGKRKK